MLGVFPTLLIREGFQPSPQNEEVDKRSQMLELSLAIPDESCDSLVTTRWLALGWGCQSNAKASFEILNSLCGSGLRCPKGWEGWRWNGKGG